MKVRLITGGPFDCNIYLLTEGDVSILIDAGTGIGPQRVQSAIDGLLKGSSLKGVALTHEHFDHSGGVGGIIGRFGGEVWCSKECARIISGPDDILTGSFLFGEVFRRIERTTVIGDRLKAGPIELEVIHTPGHSLGSVCYLHKDTGSLFCGDLMFCDGGVGRWDLPGGDLGTLRDSIRKVRALPIKALYPGHGRFETGDPSHEVEMSASALDL